MNDSFDNTAELVNIEFAKLNGIIGQLRAENETLQATLHSLNMQLAATWQTAFEQGKGATIQEQEYSKVSFLEDALARSQADSARLEWAFANDASFTWNDQINEAGVEFTDPESATLTRLHIAAPFDHRAAIDLALEMQRKEEPSQ